MGERHRPGPLVSPRGDVVEGVLLVRENRFRAAVQIGRRRAAAHVPNPGRMHELMIPGRSVHLVAADRPGRATAYDLLAVDHEGEWVCIDNRLGGRLARLALESHVFPELEPYTGVDHEVSLGHSRLDHRLVCGAAPPCWVETKSCTLVIAGCGRFPDAPTVRGRRHVELLAERVAAGERAAVLFVVQRPDARAVAPNDDTDPAFGAALRAAARAGVTLLAAGARWTRRGLALEGRVAVVL